MNHFSEGKKRELCQCTPRCKKVVLIVKDDFAYQVCEKGTAEFAYELLKAVGQVADSTRIEQTRWTPLQIQQLKEYVLAFGGVVPKGAYAKFAAQLGKDRRQISNKVQVLRKQGELPPLWSNK